MTYKVEGYSYSVRPASRYGVFRYYQTHQNRNTRCPAAGAVYTGGDGE